LVWKVLSSVLASVSCIICDVHFLIVFYIHIGRGLVPRTKELLIAQLFSTRGGGFNWF